MDKKSRSKLSTKIKELLKLEKEISEVGIRLHGLIRRASSLGDALHGSVGDRFVLDGVAYKLVHKALEYGIVGNRYWLMEDDSVIFIEEKKNESACKSNK